MEWKKLTSETPPEGTPLLLSLNGEVQRRVYDYDESDGTFQSWYEECKPFKISDRGCCQWMILPEPTKD